MNADEDKIVVTTDDALFARALGEYCALGGHSDVVARVQDAGTGVLHVSAGAGSAMVLPQRLGAVIDRARALGAARYAGELAFGDCVLQMAGAVLRRGDMPVRLTEKERDILAALHRAGDKGLERAELLAVVWGYSAAVETHTLETHIYRLRQKIEADPANPVLLLTDGNGYRLAP